MVVSLSGQSAASSVPLLPPAADSAPPAARFFLEITRGRTRFRRRPVNSSRFLIGGGVTCDLRLGGERIPVLHSIITVNGGEVHIEAMAPRPELIVNGQPVREARLSDGDVIGIGDVELLARLSVGRAPAGAQSVTGPALPDAADRPVSELSAVELIERIEAEERQIEEFEERRGLGVSALLNAVRNRAAGAPADRKSDAPVPRAVPAPHFLSKRPQVLAAQGRAVAPLESRADSGLVRELEVLGRQLTALSHELQSTSERANIRESQYAAATDLLMETQHKLASQLETLVSQVGTMQQVGSPAKPRAIA